MTQRGSAPSPRTHGAIDPRWSGTPEELGPGAATARLVTRPEMAADESGLVHGGFLFSLADYAGMLAVDEPNVVLAAASCRFLRPVRVGEVVVAEARVSGGDARRPQVAVVVRRDGEPVLEVELSCAVPRRHVLATEEPEGDDDERR